MQILSWQTYMLVNCMGTLKRKVKPKDLYDGVNLIDKIKKLSLKMNCYLYLS